MTARGPSHLLLTVILFYVLFQTRTGVALLTLLINGSLAAPLLRKLGLADSPEKRKRIVQGLKDS